MDGLVEVLFTTEMPDTMFIRKMAAPPAKGDEIGRDGVLYEIIRRRWYMPADDDEDETAKMTVWIRQVV